MNKFLLTFAAGLAVASGADAQDAMKTKPHTNATYRSADGTELTGYLATPPGGEPAPGVLLVHEWWGLNQDMANLADALAAEGYVVLAADAFRGSLALDPSQAMAQVRGTPPEQIAADLDAALAYLRSLPSVSSKAVATMGFCFGGTHSFFLGTRSTGLGGVVIFYGSGIATDVPAMGNLGKNGPVLGIFGAEDGGIPAERVAAFGDTLQAIGAVHTLTTYPGVGHAFVKSSTYRSGGAATEAWAQLVGFLKETLGR